MLSAEEEEEAAADGTCGADGAGTGAGVCLESESGCCGEVCACAGPTVDTETVVEEPNEAVGEEAVSYTHLTLPTTPYV